MAENLRFVETLDHSNFDKGIAESTQAVRKLAEDAELANKGLKGMFDTPAMKEAAATFSGVTKAVEGFTRAMSRGLPMKQELRETQKAAMQLEQIWRGLSDAEKQSAAGQELRSKIDMLIQRGGVLKDTMIDVGNAIKFQASDTAKLDAVVGGLQAMTAAAQTAAGAAALLGANQEAAAKVQKDLMAVMSIANGLQTIQNALQKESALMMGLSAARTAALNAAMAVKVAMAKADTTATKAAAAAQALWNTAVKANPIGLLVTVLAAAAAAVYAYSQKVSEAQKVQAQFNEEMKKQTENIATSTTQLTRMQIEWAKLTDNKQRQEWIKQNADAFKSLGVQVSSVADAESVLVKNTDKVVEAMSIRAEAAAHAAVAQSLMQEAIALEQQAAERAANPSFWDKAASSNYQEAQERGQRHALDMQKQALVIRQKVNDEMLKSVNLMQRAAKITGGLTSGTTTTTTAPRATRSTPTSAGTPDRQVIEGTLEWFNQLIQKEEDLANQTAKTTSEWQAFQKKIDELKRQRDFLFGDWRNKLDLSELAPALNTKLLDLKVKPLVIPVTFKDPIEAAKEASQQLLDKTAGLRTAAQAAAGAFRELGNAIGGQAGKMVNVAGMLAQAIATMIQSYATALAQAATMGPWAWAAFGLTGLGQLMAMIAGVRSAAGFAQGGIVGGTSYTGDKQYIRVNSGEMILNGQQQARLFSMINSGGGGGKVEFEISGQKLRGVLNNYDSKMGKVR